MIFVVHLLHTVHVLELKSGMNQDARSQDILCLIYMPYSCSLLNALLRLKHSKDARGEYNEQNVHIEHVYIKMIKQHSGM